MREELSRYACMAADQTPCVVVEYRHIFMVGEADNVRRHHGSIWLALEDGEPVRLIDEQQFEVVATGEKIRRLAPR